MAKTKIYIFGYGSLVDYLNTPDVRLAKLKGSRRKWNVCMDNSDEISGNSFCIQPVTKFRPPIFVTFLNILIEQDMGSTTNGLLIPVGSNLLEKLDIREWNYERIDVTERIQDPPASAKIYT